MSAAWLTLAALTGFAANSLLTRGAVEGGHLDPMTFMVIRLLSGTLMLTVLVRLRRTPAVGRGSWRMAAALAGYAVAFTLAYESLTAGAGALLLFAAVHLTMFGTGLARGERPAAPGLVGTALAAAGLLTLTMPGVGTPAVTGVLLMLVAGACWALYSLDGRRAADPLATTTDNFLRATVIGLPIAWVTGDGVLFTWPGLGLAVISGAVASGLAYAAWYAVLPSLPAWRAALLQLSVPLLAALGAVLFLAEPLTTRVVVAMVLVISGVALSQRAR